jgi:hypothetical protein
MRLFLLSNACVSAVSARRNQRILRRVDGLDGQDGQDGKHDVIAVRLKPDATY